MIPRAEYERQLSQSSRSAKRARTSRATNTDGSLSLCELMRCVLQQAPTVMLCLLDRATQRSLRSLFPSLVITRRLNTARELYDAHWMNEPFYHSMLRVERSRFWRFHTDLRLRIVRDDDAAEITTSDFGDDPFFDSPGSWGTSCWEASPRGASLTLYCWNWSEVIDRSICIDIKLLADRARRIVAVSDYRCWVDLVGARSKINRFDPELWHEDAQLSADSSIWITMIVEYSRARDIAALAPLLALAPDHIFE